MTTKGQIATAFSKAVAIVLSALLVFGAGIFVGIKFFAPALTRHYTTESKIIEKPIMVQGETKIVTDTQIAYVPKETIVYKYIDAATGQTVAATGLEKADIDANIGKTEVHVRLNGRELTVSKADDEQVVFEKNKLALMQTSTIAFEAIVTPTIIDKTKRWAIGIGYGSNGVAGKIDFPAGKYGGWIYGDRSVRAGGIEIPF